MKKCGILAALVALFVGLSTALGAPALKVKDAIVIWGVPWWESTPPPPPAGAKGPMVLELSEIDPADNTKLVKRIVKIDNLPAFTYPVAVPPFVFPPFNPLTDNIFVYNAAKQNAYNNWLNANRKGIAQNKAAWETASKDKSDKIAAAINGVLGAGRATSDTYANPATGFTQGRTTITGIQKVRYGNKSNTTGEVGDGTKYKDGTPGGASPYPYKMSMGTATGITVATATGNAPQGEPSIIQFGIDEIYVSTWLPNAGDSLDQVLSYMEQDLDSHGLPATFDGLAHTLSLDGDFTDEQTAIWAMSEIAWDGELGVSFGSNAPESVPEPASLLLLGVAGIAFLKRRRT